MDYGTFVAGRRATWKETEAELRALPRGGLQELDFLALETFVARHRALSAELGLVQARWPGSEAEATLRRLVLRGHGVLSPPSPGLFRRAWHFFSEEYPRHFQACLPSLQVAVLVFCGGVWLGFVLTTVDEGVAALLVGPDALQMIRQGEIWTDNLEEVSPFFLSVQIFVNNILVALFAWAGGVLFGLGSTLALLRNAAMVGSIVAICLRYGIADRLFAFIPAHGLLELSLIVVAGAAGFELARGVFGEGEGNRSERFGRAAIRSFWLVGGTIPWFVLLGFVEGFFSPQMGFATEWKLVVGALLLALFLLYALLPRYERSPP